MLSLLRVSQALRIVVICVFVLVRSSSFEVYEFTYVRLWLHFWGTVGGTGESQ